MSQSVSSLASCAPSTVVSRLGAEIDATGCVESISIARITIKPHFLVELASCPLLLIWKVFRGTFMSVSKEADFRSILFNQKGLTYQIFRFLGKTKKVP